MDDRSNDQGSVSPLRQRMIEDMTIRGFAEHSKRDYIRHVRTFAAFLGRSPDLAEPEDLRRYHVTDQDACAAWAQSRRKYGCDVEK
jgi:integrase/recombinase XerD